MATQAAIDPDWLKDELERPGRSQSDLARFMKFSSAAIVNRMCKGERKISAEEADKIRAYLAGTERGSPLAHIGNTPDLPPDDPAVEYVAVEILPTFAGMGGGGTGDADRETALISRRLVHDELRARPADLLLINVRGNSMEPLFFHGDQLLIDCRDTDPVQPGPFAIWDETGYVVKNVERSRGRLRIWSNNSQYSSSEYDPAEGQQDFRIMGRPVWFARRL
jgi:phage repressor protein C with HTH and peptisase S24 domain